MLPVRRASAQKYDPPDNELYFKLRNHKKQKYIKDEIDDKNDIFN